MTETKVIACIASRMESTRLPEKVLADVNGKPMNEWLVNRLKTCKSIDEIIICTTDTEKNEALVQEAKKWNIKSFKGSENDVLKRFIDAGDQYNATHIIRVTGDNIFTDPEYLDQQIQEHIDSNAEYSRVNNLPLGFTGEVMNLEMAKNLHASLEDSEQTEYMVLYAYNPEKYNCLVLEAKPEHKRPYYAITIDTPTDLELVRNIFDDFKEEPTGPSIDQIINWLDEHQDKRIELSDDTPIRMPYGKMITYSEFMALMNKRADIARGKQSFKT